MFEAVGHEVTRLKRVRFGGLEVGDLEPGAWRDVTRAELRIECAFPADAHAAEVCARLAREAKG